MVGLFLWLVQLLPCGCYYCDCDCCPGKWWFMFLLRVNATIRLLRCGRKARKAILVSVDSGTTTVLLLLLLFLVWGMSRRRRRGASCCWCKGSVDASSSSSIRFGRFIIIWLLLLLLVAVVIIVVFFVDLLVPLGVRTYWANKIFKEHINAVYCSTKQRTPARNRFISRYRQVLIFLW